MNIVKIRSRTLFLFSFVPFTRCVGYIGNIFRILCTYIYKVCLWLFHEILCQWDETKTTFWHQCIQVFQCVCKLSNKFLCYFISYKKMVDNTIKWPSFHYIQSTVFCFGFCLSSSCVCLVYQMLSVSLNSLFLIDPSVFSNVYLLPTVCHVSCVPNVVSVSE